MEELLLSLLSSSPGLVGAIIIVILFLKHMNQKDERFLKDLDKRDEHLNKVIDKSLGLIGRVGEKMDDLDDTLRNLSCQALNPKRKDK